MATYKHIMSAIDTYRQTVQPNHITLRSEYTTFRLHNHLISQPSDYTTIRIYDNQNIRQSEYTTVRTYDNQNIRQSEYTTIRIHSNQDTCQLGCIILHTEIRLFLATDYPTPSPQTILFDPFSKKYFQQASPLPEELRSWPFLINDDPTPLELSLPPT